MVLNDYEHNQAVERERDDHDVTVKGSPTLEDSSSNQTYSKEGHGPKSKSSTVVDEISFDADPKNDLPVSAKEPRPAKSYLTSRWWLLAAGSALVVTILTVAAIILLTRKPTTVEKIVITTVPSGADVKLDSSEYGLSPVKLEQLAKGTYTVTITKEGFEPIVEQIIVSDEKFQFDYKLRPIVPGEEVPRGLSREEKIEFSQRKLEEAFAQGHYGVPYAGSALNYADYILDLDRSSDYASKRREDILLALQQQAREARERGELGLAQEIYTAITQNFPGDKTINDEAARLDSQIASQQDKVRDFVRRAREAINANNIAGAYSYSKQALKIDRQNAEARGINAQVKERYLAQVTQAYERGEVDEAGRRSDEIIKMFPEDRQLRAQLSSLEAGARSEKAKKSDAVERREQGLAKYRHLQYAEAIQDLEYAIINGQGTTDVIFSLAYSHMKLGQYGQAERYFRMVPSSTDSSYRSAIAALGEIALQRGDTTTALEKFKEAKQLGGSTLYTIPQLEAKIEGIEKRQREKAAEPTPLTIQAKHLHGSLKGSCSGTLTVNSTGARYDSKDDQFSWNLLSVGVQVKNDELIILVQNKSEKFKVGRAAADRFRETLARYQTPIQ